MSAAVDATRRREDPPAPPSTASPCALPASISDVSIALLALISQSRGVQSEVARADAENAHRRLQELREEIQEALERAEAAGEDAGFWADVGNVLGSDVATIAGVVAAVALAVATGGAGAPAIIALAAATMTAGAKVADELGADTRVTALMGAAGAVAGLFAGNAVGAGNVWTTIAHIANGTQGLARAGSGGATIVEGQFRADELRARADAQGFRSDEAAAWLRFDLAVQALTQACRDVERAKSGASNIEQNESAGRSALIARMAGLS